MALAIHLGRYCWKLGYFVPQGLQSGARMKDLLKGAIKFRRDVFPGMSELFGELVDSQKPTTLFIGCSDSRVVPELLTQQGPGRLFVVRNAGNIVPSYGSEPGGVSAAIEYGITALRVQDVVVCGHSGCGAMSAINSRMDLSRMPAVASWLRYADAAKLVNETYKFTNPIEQLESLVRQNVLAQLQNLRTHPSVAAALAHKELRLHGWVYEIASGKIRVLDFSSGEFCELQTDFDIP